MLKGLTVQYLLRQTYKVKAGETILFHAAAGGVGLIACQWARALGVTVIGTVGSDEKAALAKAHGCTHTIVYTRENFVERVKEITGGKGVPVVYDSVGKDTFPASLDCLSPRGLLVSFGNASGADRRRSTSCCSRRRARSTRRARRSFTYIATRAALTAAADEMFDARARRQDRQRAAADIRAEGRGGRASRAGVARDGRRDGAAAVAASTVRWRARAALTSAARGVGGSSDADDAERPGAGGDQRVGRRAVNAHGVAQRGLRVEALGEQRADVSRRARRRSRRSRARSCRCALMSHVPSGWRARCRRLSARRARAARARAPAPRRGGRAGSPRCRWPSSRAASAGCGVSTVGAVRAASAGAAAVRRRRG